MNYINNFSAALVGELSELSQSLPIAPDDLSRVSNGMFTLTIAPALTAEQAEREIIVISDGVLSRGQEGTTAKPWPAGTLVYAAATAGMLTAAQSDVHLLVDRIGREVGVYPPPVYEYNVANRTQDYYSSTSLVGLTLITPIKGGIAAARSGYDTYYEQPPSVIIATLSGETVSVALNPDGVNWSRWGETPHGYDGFGAVVEARGDAWLMPRRAGPTHPPVKIDLSGAGVRSTNEAPLPIGEDSSIGGFAIGDKIYTTGSRYVFDVVRKIYSEMYEPIPIGTLWVTEGSRATGLSSTAMYSFSGFNATKRADLSRRIDIGTGPVWVGRNGQYYAHDFTVDRLVKVSSSGVVTDCASSPVQTLYAQGADGDLLGLNDGGVAPPNVSVGSYDTSNDTYTDISHKTDVGSIESALALRVSGGNLWLSPSKDSNYAAVGASSGGVFYFVLSWLGRWSVIAISKR